MREMLREEVEARRELERLDEERVVVAEKMKRVERGVVEVVEAPKPEFGWSGSWER